MITFEQVNIGDELPIMQSEKISRTTLALYAGASGDHNPIHIDIDVAKAAGMDDVFAQGMLSMAYLGRLITAWVPQQSIREFEVRFSAITQLQAKITCSAVVTDKYQHNNKNLICIDVIAQDQCGEIKLSGKAIIELNNHKENNNES